MLVITGDPGDDVTVSGRVLEAVCCGLLLSRTVTVTLKLPATVGVPKSTPSVEFIDIPLGSPVADQLKGAWPPVAINGVFAAYPTPTVAVGGSKAVLVIVSAWPPVTWTLTSSTRKLVMRFPSLELLK